MENDDLLDVENKLNGHGLSLKRAIGLAKTIHKNSKKRVTYKGEIKPDEEYLVEQDLILANLILEKKEIDGKIIERIDFLLGK